jgi:exo-1,4-beta-D-glucosaminidase
MKRPLGFLVTSLSLAILASGMGTSAAEPGSARLMLHEGWQVQSSARVSETGESLSKPQFRPSGWYETSVPATVMAVLVENHVYPDPYFGMNLRKVPGVSYPIGSNFSNIPMPDDSPFRVPWWYRTEFKVPADYAGKQVWLNFDGINFRANIWLNGRQIATSEKVAGAYRLYEFNVTDAVKPGERNALAVEVFAPKEDDLAITWVDWNPAPPDKDMGLWHHAYLTASGPVAVRYPQVVTHFDLPSLKVAHLTVNAELKNGSDKTVKGVVKGQIENIEFSQPVELAAHESKAVTFAPAQFSQLNVSNPRIWWPAHLGPQNLYTLKMECEVAGKVSDVQSVKFGIREVTSELNQGKYRLFQINGKNILIRGAGWTPDMMFRATPERKAAEILYVKDMHLNTIRLEGKLEDEDFYEVCDREGILVLAGWCCCAHWERWKRWKEEDYPIAAESLKSQILRLRNHPCVFDWLNGSDNPPVPEVEEMYIKILKELNWPNPYQSSATQKTTTVTGVTGVKMTGPYEYVAPSYWLQDKEHGGAYGFNTETSPGPAVPPVDSLRKFLPADKLWPINEYWDYHAGGGEFKNINVFTKALEGRYGPASSLEDYVWKAQLMAYEGERAMFEAYGRNKYTSTGVIQWMLQNAWPSIIWHLYDYYLRPAGGYFGTKKACEPLHIQYSYDDGSIVVVNSYYEEFKGLKATAKVYNLDLSEKFSKTEALDVAPDSSNKVFVLPEIEGLSTTYFLSLALDDSEGKRFSTNFYWLSTKPDVSEWGATKWYYTPIESYADLSGLKDLPKVKLKVSSQVEHKYGQDAVLVTVENPAPHLAFFVHLRVIKGQGGEEVLPVLWQDNYFSVMPGGKRQVIAVYAHKDLEGSAPVVTVDGWNVASE